MKRLWATPAWVLVSLVWVAVADGQSLVPLGDDVDEPLLPAGINNADVEMRGRLAYFWTADDGTNVVHIVGDFELDLGPRRLEARQAVVWLTPKTHDRDRYVQFEIVLWRDAVVTEPAGTVTRGPVLYVTLNSSGSVTTSADRKTFESSAETEVYKHAERIRAVMIARLAERGAMESPVTVLDLGAEEAPPEPEVRPPVTYQGRDMTVDLLEGQTVVTAVGDVYVYRGDPRGGDALELRADAAVVYLAAEADEAGQDTGEGVDRPGRARPDEKEAAVGALPETIDAVSGVPGMGIGGQVEGVYLEGDIVLTSGERMVRASRLYYDFAHDRALILDAVVRTFDPRRSLPIYLRAQLVRQLTARKFQAQDAMLTTSEFFTPHYHVGAEEVIVVDERRRDPLAPSEAGQLAGTYELKKTTFNVSGVPILYWPYAKGSLSDSETSIKNVRTGFSDDFGVEFESRWELFNVLGLEKPAGFDASLLLDYFSKRGPAVGVDLDYQTDNYFGLYRGYYIHDTGEDNLGGRFRDEQPDTENRGRTTLRHRQYLPDDWQLTFELSYLSDKNFLEEYFENEYDAGKEQESLLYLKKQVDNWAFTAHLQYRLHEFLETVERLPEFGFILVGEPVGEFGTFFSDNRAGLVRYRAADRGLMENLLHGGREDGSGTVVRGDTRQEVEVPIPIGDFKLVPFGSIRGSAWDDSPESGGLGRAHGTYGVRASTYAWRLYPDVVSDLLDVDGVRHVIKADAVAWASHANRDADELFQFDETVEGVGEFDGASLGVRQRWQTKRGAAGRQRIVDLLTLDLEAGFFNDAAGDDITNGFTSYSRPSNSIARNYANGSVMYRINDTTNVASELNVDLNDGTLDVFNVSYAVERTPRLSYLIGYRYIGEIESNYLGLGMNYRISEKYILAVREQFDLDRGKTAEFDVGIIRRFPRWYVGVTVSVDDVEDDFGLSLSAWPEGLPRAALGHRRFTGLTESTGIQPGS